MMIICLVYICTLVLHLTPYRYLDDLHFTRLQITHIMSNLVMTKYLCLGFCAQGTSLLSTYSLTIFMMKFTRQFGYINIVPCKTNPCRKMNSNYYSARILDGQHQPWASNTSSTTWWRSDHHNPRYVIPPYRSFAPSHELKKLNKVSIHQNA